MNPPNKQKQKNRNVFKIHQKKAQSKTLVVIILCLVVGLMLILFGYKVTTAGEDANIDEKCRLSIFAASVTGKIKEGSGDIIDLQNAISCDRKKISIDKKHVVKGGKINDLLVKDTLGYEMASCWNKVGKGDMDPFKKFWGSVEDSYCLICANIEFTPKFKELATKEGYNLQNFDYYLATRRLPGQKQMLLEYLGGKTTLDPSTLAQLNQNKETQLNLDESYVVVWRVEKNDPGMLETAASMVLGAAAFTAVTAAGIVAFSVAAPVVAISTATTGLVGGGVRVAGAILGIGGHSILSGDTYISQQVVFAQESDLSGNIILPPDSKEEDKEKPFCTVLLN